MLNETFRQFHQARGATWTEVRGAPVVKDYGDLSAEYAALNTTVAVIDLTSRGRLCLLGADRQEFLHGQVTNEVAKLKPGQGCYAALVNAKGRIQSDLHLYVLASEILLDFEPGLTAEVLRRLEQFVIADDVQVVDVGSTYSLLSIQGPSAPKTLELWGWPERLPSLVHQIIGTSDPHLGEVYLARLPRVATEGFDLFVPTGHWEAAAQRLTQAVESLGGRWCGWHALEITRIEAGIPRFGEDMDETNLAPETGIEPRAISYTKGCYIGQEVIARIRTYGQVAKALRGLHLSKDLPTLPRRGDPLHHGGKSVGYVTSATDSPALGAKIALGYVRKEVNKPGTELTLISGDQAWPVFVADLPFVRR